MTVEIDGRIYYRTHEVCTINRISKSTLLRWIRNGIIEDTSLRDWRGWRLFSQEELQKIKEVASTIQYVDWKHGKSKWKDKNLIKCSFSDPLQAWKLISPHIITSSHLWNLRVLHSDCKNICNLWNTVTIFTVNR